MGKIARLLGKERGLAAERPTLRQLAVETANVLRDNFPRELRTKAFDAFAEELWRIVKSVGEMDEAAEKIDEIQIGGVIADTTAEEAEAQLGEMAREQSARPELVEDAPAGEAAAEKTKEERMAEDMAEIDELMETDDSNNNEEEAK